MSAKQKHFFIRLQWRFCIDIQHNFTPIQTPALSGLDLFVSCICKRRWLLMFLGLVQGFPDVLDVCCCLLLSYVSHFRGRPQLSIHFLLLNMLRLLPIMSSRSVYSKTSWAFLCSYLCSDGDRRWRHVGAAHILKGFNFSSRETKRALNYSFREINVFFPFCLSMCTP